MNKPLPSCAPKQNLSLGEIQRLLAQVSDIYAKLYAIDRTPDWYLLKAQEELGELVSAHLKATGRARVSSSNTDVAKNLRDELADAIAMLLLFAQQQNIDVEEALQDKWLHYLEA